MSTMPVSVLIGALVGQAMRKRIRVFFFLLTPLMCVQSAEASPASYVTYTFKQDEHIPHIKEICAAFETSNDRCARDNLGLIHTDLNDDGRDEMIVQLTTPNACGSAGCQAIFFRIGDRAKEIMRLSLGDTMVVYAHKTKGYHDIGFFEPFPATNENVRTNVWQWNGTQYELTCQPFLNPRMPEQPVDEECFSKMR